MATNQSLIDQLAWQRMLHDAWSIDIPVSAKMTAIALRAAKAEGHETYMLALGYALERRRQRLTYDTVTQRQWQTRVSRRPQRGNHHDSWSNREKYMTGRR